MPNLTIGRVAEAADCKVQTVRYYERIGLLDPPGRTAGNQRHYGPEAVERLKFIRRSRVLGFSLKAIRGLLDLAGDGERPCAQADAIAAEQLVEVERRIERLQALREELHSMVAACHGGRIAECRVIDALGEGGVIGPQGRAQA